MKKELHPGVIAAVIVCLVVVIGVYFWKSALTVPNYPGASAGHPAAETGGAGGGSSALEPPTKVVSQEEAINRRIPGVSHPPGSGQ